MPAYFSGYPNYINMPNGDYSVFDTGEHIYTGNIYPFPNQETSQMNISEIVEQHIPCPEYYKHINSGSAPFYIVNHSFGQYYIQVNKSDGTSNLFEYLWGYPNYEISNGKLNTDSVISDYITPWVYPGTMVPASIYTSEDYDVEWDLLIPSGISTLQTKYVSFPGSTSANNGLRLCMFKMGIVSSNDKLILNFHDENKGEQLSIRDCIPENTYTIYYVNRLGGFSFVHCTGTNTVKNSNTKSTFLQKPDMNLVQYPGTTNYAVSTYTTYTLNTPILSDDKSNLIQDLFISPQVYIYEYSSQLMKAINITDKSVECKIRKNKHIYNYTIQAQDSQTLIMHA